MLINKKIVSITSWIAVILWMLLILSFSSDPAEVSKKKSGMILEKVKSVIERVEERFQVEFLDNDKLHFYIRKNAHVFSYFVLSILLVLAWKSSTGAKGFKPYYLAWLLATGFSVSDEFYQTFIPGRSGELRDVLVDNVGVVMGLMLVYWFRRKT